MGDLNDVWGSLPLKRFAEAGLKDAWWDGGFGYGATIHRPLAYRIDHVMYGVSEGFKFPIDHAQGWRQVSDGLKGSESLKGLRLKGIKKVSANGLSDHDALVADFEIE